ncbi:MAG: hypothetical protein K2K57_12070 [Oscillospiraceae bacterium]|nr:hypothetical protein [Oscillospiraceae bacterium]
MDIFIDHGQKIYVIEPCELDEAIERLLKEDWERSRGPWAHWDWHLQHYYDCRDFVKEYSFEGLRLGYCYWNGNEEKESATLMYIYKGEYGYQRYQPERAKCLECGTYWHIANPSYYDIYPNYGRDFDISEVKYPLLCCPECGGKLSRDSIWCGRKVDFNCDTRVCSFITGKSTLLGDWKKEESDNVE